MAIVPRDNVKDLRPRAALTRHPKLMPRCSPKLSYFTLRSIEIHSAKAALNSVWPLAINRNFQVHELRHHWKKTLISSMPFLLGPAISLGFTLLIVRRESPETFGAYSLAIALHAFIVGFSDAGLKNYLLSQKQVEPHIKSDQYFLTHITLFFSLFLILCAHLFLSFDNYSETTRLIWTLVAIESISLAVLHKSLTFAAQARDTLPTFSRIDTYGKLLYGAIKISTYLYFSDLATSIATSSTFSLVFYFLILYRSLKLRPSAQPASFLADAFKSIASLYRKRALWTPFGLSFLAFYLYFTSNKIIISFQLGEEALAAFSVAHLFISLGEIPLAIIWAIYMPKICRAGENKNFIKSLWAMFIFSAGLVLAYAIFSLQLYPYIIPQKYNDSALLLVGMSLYFIFRYPNLVLEIELSAKQRYKQFTRIRISVAALALLTNILLLPIYGLWVTVACMVFSEAVVTALSFRKAFDDKPANC